MAEVPRLDFVRKIARRFGDPPVAILSVAAAISGAPRELVSFAIIVVIISIAPDVRQEHPAERASAALKRTVAVHADLGRDGAVTVTLVEQ